MSVMYYILGFMLFGALGFVFYLNKTFKHLLIIKRLSGSSKIVKSQKLRLVYNKDGSSDFYFMNNRVLPRPPETALNMNERGGYVIEAYFDGNQYHWITDKTKKADLPEFQPFSQDQRTFMILQNIKAEKDRGEGWSKYVPMIASGLIIVIVMFMAFMVYENWNETAVQLNSQNVQIAQSNERIVEIISKLDESLQTIQNTNAQTKPD